MAAQSAGGGESAAALVNGSASPNKCGIAAILPSQRGSGAQDKPGGFCFRLPSQAEELLQDSEEDREDRDGLTCAVCLDISICPHICPSASRVSAPWPTIGP